MLEEVVIQNGIPTKLQNGRTHHPVLESRSRSKIFLVTMVKYQAEIASILIIATWSSHLLHPPWRFQTSKFLYLSYKSSLGNKYRQGPDDVCFVLAWIINFIFLRAICIKHILCPLASTFGIVKRKRQLRFAEQGWLILYDMTLWGLGMHIWMTSTYWLDNSAIWEAWPTRDMDGTLKWYCLVQLAFWVQQILVIHIEARRKDYAQMLMHHIVTCCLITTMYIYRFTKVGNVVLCLMDVVDFLLPIAKILQYLQYKTACNLAFGVFVVTWLVARHILFPQLCLDIFRDVPSLNTIAYGCYSGETSELLTNIPSNPDYISHLFWPIWNESSTICVNRKVKWTFLGMLLLIQILSLIWFGMIVQIAFRMMIGHRIKDTRSDEDCDVEEYEMEALSDGKIKEKVGTLEFQELTIPPFGEEEVRTSNQASVLRRPTRLNKWEMIMGVENRRDLFTSVRCEKPL